MTQITINGIALPELNEGKYRCYPETMKTDLRMASGRAVTEIGYEYIVVEAGPYDAMQTAYKDSILSALRSSSFAVSCLPDIGEAIEGTFKCVRLTPPTYAFSKGTTAYWSGLSFRLEGVDPIA